MGKALSKILVKARLGQQVQNGAGVLGRALLSALALAGSTQALAAPVNLLAPSEWIFYATGGVQGGTLTVGDTVGYDKQDVDHDQNPYNAWFGTGATTDQGVDYDEAITALDFTPPLSITWTGCFPATSYGYNNIFVGRRNTAFTGATGSKQYPINQEFGYTMRWDYSGLNTVVSTGGRNDVQGISAATQNSSGKYCGDYRIDWAQDVLDFYFNGSKVRTQPYAYQGPVAILVRSFERSHTITAMQVTAATVGGQKPAKDPGIANVFGANVVGTVVNAATGQRTPLNGANTAISGDVNFVTADDGRLLAHVSGKGAAQGMAFRYDVDYDLVSGNLAGTVTDNTTNIAKPITFTDKGNLTWGASISNGSGRSSSGDATAYDLEFDVVLPPESVKGGTKFPPGGRFVVNLSQTQPISVPVVIAPLNYSNTFSSSIVTEGEMVVTMVPSGASFTLTGDVEGAFRMDPPISFSTQYTPPVVIPGFTIPPVTISATVDPSGRFSGSLTGNTAQNNLRFTGNWSAISSDGSTAGGTLDMPIPIDPKTGDVPATATLTIQGVVRLSVSGIPTGIPVTPPKSVSFSQQVQVPLNFQPQ
jgi:hypothetical protein